MKKIFIALFLFIGLLQVSCSPETVSNSPTTNPVDVYVAGSKDGQACYWKNGQVVMLDSGILTNTEAKKIIVSNGNVYILGYKGNTNPYTSLFWKNGVLTNLTTSLSTSANTMITDMDIVGNDMYLVGYVLSIVTVPNLHLSLVYWKNNTFTTVKNYNNSFFVEKGKSKIKVMSNDVYITAPSDNLTGSINPNGGVNGYYKNNVFTEILPFMNLKDFAVNNNSIFTYGSQLLSGFHFNITTNTNTTVNFPNDGSILNMCFDNNNIYYSNGATIYKNGSLYNTSQAITQISDFKVLHDNLYKINTSSFGAPIDIQTVSINNIITLTSSTGESFNSLFIVQN